MQRAVKDHSVISLSRAKTEAATIRRIFQGEPEAYSQIIAQYQPMVYAVALAHTGNVFLADKAVVMTFEEGYGRLASLTDARKLGMVLCAIAQSTCEQLTLRRVPNWNKPRPRDGQQAPVDLNYVQTELIEPLGEELGSFTLQERKGILLHAFCGLSAKRIADVLKIDKKEAAEDLARTQENVEKALLKEVVKTLDPEINNEERLLHILSQVGGAEVVAKASARTHVGSSRQLNIQALMGGIAVLVLVITVYFGYRVFTNLGADDEVSSRAPFRSETAETGEPTETAPRSPAMATNYVLQGRVVDARFLTDGVAGVIVETGGMRAETDFYGGFEIRGVSRGQHDVVVKSNNTVMRQGLRMHTEESNDPIGIEVDENVPARFSFRGRVFDRVSGQAITRFEVATCKGFPDMMQPYLLRLFREQRHAEGMFRDRFVTLGDYTMYVRAHGYAPLPVQFTIDENWTGDRVFEFPLYRASGVICSVYSASELSVSGASVMPRQGTAYGVVQEMIDYGRTDSMGRLELYNLPVGIQSFMVTHLQHGMARAIVETEPGKTVNARIQFPRRGSLTGDITLYARPTTFRSFRRRLGGSTVDLSKNINYLSSGQYEIVLTPEPLTITASVAPTNSDRWFDRRMEQETRISMVESTWLDFNFHGGPGIIQGSISARGAAAAIFAEVSYLNEGSADHISFKLNGVGGFRLDNLPLGRGEITVYAAPRATDTTEFLGVRTLMDRQIRPFTIDEDQDQVYLDFSL